MSARLVAQFKKERKKENVSKVFILLRVVKFKGKILYHIFGTISSFVFVYK